jgi:hypothetical protein
MASASASASASATNCYPSTLRNENDLLAREHLKNGELEQAAWCLAKRELAGNHIQCHLVAIAAEPRNIFGQIAFLPRADGNYPIQFTWTKRFTYEGMQLTYQFGSEDDLEKKFSFIITCSM